MFFINSINLTDSSLNLSEKDDLNENSLNSSLIKDYIFNDGLPSFNIDENDFSQSFFFKKTKESDINKKSKLFDIKPCGKKRGRKSEGINKKPIHCSSSYDNVKRKIQVQFLSFMRLLLNDSIRAFSKEKKKFFLEFDYKLKSKISKKNFDKLKNSTIEDLLINLGISNKYTKYEKDYNKLIIEALNKNNKWFRKIFKMKYVDLFKDFYNDEKPLKELTLFEKKIILSKETKSFFDLIEQNKEMKEDIINVTKSSFLPENDKEN